MAQKPNAAVVPKPETADLRGENRLHIAVGSADDSRSKPPRLHGSGAGKYRGRYASGTKGGEEASESPRFTRGEARSVTGAAHHLPLLPGLTAEARARFWKHVKVSDPRECWEWTGARRGVLMVVVGIFTELGPESPAIDLFFISLCGFVVVYGIDLAMRTFGNPRP